MEFSIRCAYAHGTSALRTHLINMAPKQIELTWPAFSALRKKWAGKVRLQTCVVGWMWGGARNRPWGDGRARVGDVQDSLLVVGGRRPHSCSRGLSKGTPAHHAGW